MRVFKQGLNSHLWLVDAIILLYTVGHAFVNHLHLDLSSSLGQTGHHLPPFVSLTVISFGKSCLSPSSFHLAEK